MGWAGERRMIFPTGQARPSWHMRDDFSNGPGRHMRGDFSNGPGRHMRGDFSNRPYLASKKRNEFFNRVATEDQKESSLIFP